MAVGVGDAVPVANPINPNLNSANPATMVNGVVHGNIAEAAVNQEQLKAMEKYVVILIIFRVEKYFLHFISPGCEDCRPLCWTAAKEPTTKISKRSG